jgi:hypothetical protein
VGLKNDVTMDCHLEMVEYRFGERKEGESEQREEKVTSTIFEIVKALNKGRIVLDFKMRTKMDSPEFGFGVIHSAFDAKVSQAIPYARPKLVSLPVRVVGGTFSTAADLTRSVVNGTVSIGKALTSVLSHSFRREQEVLDEADSQAEAAGVK